MKLLVQLNKALGVLGVCSNKLDIGQHFKFLARLIVVLNLNSVIYVDEASYSWMLWYELVHSF